MNKETQMKKTILVAEDDNSLRNIIALKLKNKGYDVISARNGEEALSKFINSIDDVDLIILDLIMPKKNGFQVLSNIKEKNKSNIPVIILSNADESQEADTAKKLGALKYIVKSNISISELVTVVDSILIN